MMKSSAGDDNEDTPLNRFQRSMNIDYEKWHDGIGYDLKALQECSSNERKQIEDLLIKRNPLDWRDFEALATLGTPSALNKLRRAKIDSSTEIRIALIRFAPRLVNEDERISLITTALQSATLFGGLSETIDQIEEFHPPQVMDELFKGVLAREGEVAMHYAAMILFIHQKSNEPFDWDMRPFFLKFNTEDRKAREKAFLELCEKVGALPERYLPKNKIT